MHMGTVADLLSGLFAQHGFAVSPEAALEGRSGTVYTVPILAESAAGAIVVSGHLDASPLERAEVDEFARCVADVGADRGVLLHMGETLAEPAGTVLLWDRATVARLLGEARLAEALGEAPPELPLERPAAPAVHLPETVDELLPEAFRGAVAEAEAPLEVDMAALEAVMAPMTPSAPAATAAPSAPLAPASFAATGSMQLQLDDIPALPPLPEPDPIAPFPELPPAPMAAPMPPLAPPAPLPSMAMPAPATRVRPPMGAAAPMAAPAEMEAPASPGFSAPWTALAAPVPVAMPAPAAAMPAVPVAPPVAVAPVASNPSPFTAPWSPPTTPATPPKPARKPPSRPVLPVRVTLEDAKRKVKDRLFSVRMAELLLHPVHLYDYEVDVLQEGKISCDTRDGRVQVHGSDKSTLEVDPDQCNPDGPSLLPPDHPYQTTERVLRIPEERAAPVAVGHAIARHTRTVEVRVPDANNSLFYTERRKVEPKPDQVRLRPLGIHFRPAWRLHGDNGHVDLDAVDGRELDAQLRGSRTDAVLLD